MIISVNMGLKRYGSYEQDKYNISVDYNNYPSGEIYCDEYSYDGERLLDRPDFEKALASLLLGKISKKNIKAGSAEVIVYKGEKISRLHFQKIIEEWYRINFEKTSFAEDIKKLQRKYWRIAIKKKLRKKEPVNITISFDYKDRWSQSGGELVIPAEVAKWLAEQLELAARGDLRINKNSMEFEES